ncbi:hypothetical protein P7C70_g9100, partial [Phenoliferia sp. Uapishka_3]
MPSGKTKQKEVSTTPARKPKGSASQSNRKPQAQPNKAEKAEEQRIMKARQSANISFNSNHEVAQNSQTVRASRHHQQQNPPEDEEEDLPSNHHKTKIRIVESDDHQSGSDPESENHSPPQRQRSFEPENGSGGEKL